MPAPVGHAAAGSGACGHTGHQRIAVLEQLAQGQLTAGRAGPGAGDAIAAGIVALLC